MGASMTSSPTISSTSRGIASYRPVLDQPGAPYDWL
jgi:hypothetical protein